MFKGLPCFCSRRSQLGTHMEPHAHAQHTHALTETHTLMRLHTLLHALRHAHAHSPTCSPCTHTQKCTSVYTRTRERSCPWTRRRTSAHDKPTKHEATFADGGDRGKVPLRRQRTQTPRAPGPPAQLPGSTCLAPRSSSEPSAQSPLSRSGSLRCCCSFKKSDPRVSLSPQEIKTKGNGPPAPCGPLAPALQHSRRGMPQEP